MTPSNLRDLLPFVCGAVLLTACPGDDTPPEVNTTTGEDSTTTNGPTTNPPTGTATEPTSNTATMSGSGSTSDTGTTTVDPDTSATSTDSTTATGTDSGSTGTDSGSSSGSDSSGSSGSGSESSSGGISLDCEDEDLMMMLPVATMGSTLMEDNDFMPSCGMMDSNDYTYEWTAPADGTYSFDTFGSMHDTVLTLMSACDGTEIDCADDILPAIGGVAQARIVADLAAGQSILASVDGNENGDFNFNINEVLFDGYGDCAMQDYATACLIDEVCITDMASTLGVCSEFACMNDADCPASPGGMATPTCTDVTGDGAGECLLDCAGGMTCPMGMNCLMGLEICVWPA